MDSAEDVPVWTYIIHQGGALDVEMFSVESVL
jgi:hypothetical protein